MNRQLSVLSTPIHVCDFSQHHLPLKEMSKIESKQDSVSPRDLYLVQQGKCFYCGGFLSKFPWVNGHDNGYTIDHVYPKSRQIPLHMRGENNKVLSCYICNMKKSNNPPSKKTIIKLKFINNLLK